MGHCHSSPPSVSIYKNAEDFHKVPDFMSLEDKIRRIRSQEDLVSVAAEYREVAVLLRDPKLRLAESLVDFIPYTVSLVASTNDASLLSSAVRALANCVADTDRNRDLVVASGQPLLENLIRHLFQGDEELDFVGCHFIVNLQMDHENAQTLIGALCLGENSLLTCVLEHLSEANYGSLDFDEDDPAIRLLEELRSYSTIHSGYVLDVEHVLKIYTNLALAVATPLDEETTSYVDEVITQVWYLGRIEMLQGSSAQISELLERIIGVLGKTQTAEERCFISVALFSSSESFKANEQIVKSFSNLDGTPLVTAAKCVVLGNCVVSKETETMVVDGIGLGTRDLLSKILGTFNGDERPYYYYNSLFLLQKVIGNEKVLAGFYNNSCFGLLKEVLSVFFNTKLGQYHKDVVAILYKALNSLFTKTDDRMLEHSAQWLEFAQYMLENTHNLENDLDTGSCMFVCKVVAFYASQPGFVDLAVRVLEMTVSQAALPFPLVFERTKMVGCCLGSVESSEGDLLLRVLAQTRDLRDSVSNQDGLPQEQVAVHLDALTNNLRFVAARVLSLDPNPELKELATQILR